jgi:5'-nucleotidase / UDP-sugar diphosphatase
VRRALEVTTLLSGMLGNSYFLQVAGLRAEYDPARALWARIPVAGTPIPSGRAVLRAERVHNGVATPLERGDTALYHVVTDRYVASFLPMVGQVVPSLTITPRDRTGAPLADIDDAIVYRDGRELKLWEAVLEFAAAQPPDADGVPRIPASYAQPEGRFVPTRGTPLLLLPGAALLLVLVLVATLLVKRRRRRRDAARVPQRRIHVGS